MIKKSKYLFQVIALLAFLLSFVPDAASAQTTIATPPADIFQLPWTQGEAWISMDGFDNGSKRLPTSPHNYKMGGAVDFTPNSNVYIGMDTSNFWVTAAAAGTVFETSSCHIKIYHGNGWITEYWHLDNLQVSTGAVVYRNQRLGIIANSKDQKVCTGNEYPGPHLHFVMRPQMKPTVFAGWSINYNSLLNKTSFTKAGKTVGSYQPLLNVPDLQIAWRDWIVWDTLYSGSVDAYRYERWPLKLDETTKFTITAPAFSSGLTTRIILMSETGAELANASGILTSTQPAGTYFVEIRPQSGQGFYTMVAKKEVLDVTPTPTSTDGTPTPTDGTPTITPTPGTGTPSDGTLTITPTTGTGTPSDGTPTITPTAGTGTPSDGTPTITPTTGTGTPSDGTPTITPTTGTGTPSDGTPTITPTTGTGTPSDGTPTITPTPTFGTPTEAEPTFTPTFTSTPVVPTETPTYTPTPVTPTETPTFTPTQTPVVPTETPTYTPTMTPVTPTESTPTHTPTMTPVTPTESTLTYTPTMTSVTPTESTLTFTPTPLTGTPTDGTPTITPTPTTGTPTASTATITPTPTSTFLPTEPYVSTTLDRANVNAGEFATVSVSLHNVPAGGYPSAEFTCSYNPAVVEVSNIVAATLFGDDPVAAINGPQNGSLVFAIAGSNGKRATTDGTVFTFSAKGLQTGQSSIECTARVSNGAGQLASILSLGPVTLTVNGAGLTPTPTPISAPTLNGRAIASKPVTIRLYNPDNSVAMTLLANADGTFTLTAPAGTYGISASADGFLGAQGFATLTAGSVTTMSTVNLAAGDVDSNGVIDQFDAMTIGMGYNTAIPASADLNNDGTINVLDLELLAQNYRKSGVIAWQ